MSKGGPIPPRDLEEAKEWFAGKLENMRVQANGNEFMRGALTMKLCGYVNDFDRLYQAKIDGVLGDGYLLMKGEPTLGCQRKAKHENV